MKEYKGYFRSCDTSVDERGQLFRVSIYTDYSSSGTLYATEIITLTDEPFTVEYEGDSNNYQKPYKCSTATVNFLYDTYNPDFSNTNSNSMLVVLSKWRNNNWCEEGELTNTWHYSYNAPTRLLEGTVTSTPINDEYPSSYHCWEITWIGYATPNTYNQGFEGVFDEVSINAQDALSTLKYVDYEPIYQKRGAVSFSDIFKKYVKRLETYKYIYVTNSLVVRTIDEQDILHALYIHENNFFDEDDKPMKVMEVIENICQYLHITVIPYGDALYFLSYDAISKGYNDYYLWKCNDSQNFSRPYLSFPVYTMVSGTFTLQEDHNIHKDNFSENGTSLNILDAFGKVTVKDDLYPYDSIIPELNKDKYIIRQATKDNTGVIQDDRDSYQILYSDYKMTKLNFWKLNETDKHVTFLNFKCFNPINLNNTSTDIKTYWYPIDTYSSGNLTHNTTAVTSINSNRDWRINTTLNYIGCSLVEYKDYVVEVINNDHDPEKINIKSIDTDTAIAFFQRMPQDYSSGHRSDGNITYDKNTFTPYIQPLQPMIEFTSNDVAIDKDTVIKIEGTFHFYGSNTTVPFEREDNVTKDSVETCWVWATLQCGNKYLNENYEWVSTISHYIIPYFKLPLEYESDKNAFYTDYKIISEIKNRDKKKETYDDYFTVNVPITNDNTYLRDIKFTLYRTVSPRLERLSPLVLLKDFDISTKVVTEVANIQMLSKDNGSNIEYSDNLDITNNSKEIEDYPDINNKISTWRNKYPNYSNVLVSPYFFENGYSDVSNHTFNRLYCIYCKGLDDVFIPENQLTSSINTQYSNPTITLNLNLKESLGIKPWCILTYRYFPNYVFMVNSMSYDYRWNKHTINILHKYISEEEMEEGDIYVNTR